MEIAIKATPKEIAALVVALQERQDMDSGLQPLEIIRKAVHSTIGGTEQAKPSSSRGLF